MSTKIEKIIYEGWGLGIDDQSQKKVLIKKTVPGDLVEFNTVKEKPNYIEGEISNIIEPSKFRIEPQCKSFDQCGGCDHQNISSLDQLRFKEAVFAETLERAKIDVKIEKIIAGSTQCYFYRNVMRYFFVENNGEISISMNRTNYKDGLLPITNCLLLSRDSQDIINGLLCIINKNASAEAFLLSQLRIRHGKNTDQYMIEIITKTNILPCEKEIIDYFKKLEKVKSLYHTVSSATNLSDGRRRLLIGSPVIFEKIGAYTFQISPESFFQTNSLGVKNLYDKIKEIADLKIGENVLDLYCGTGTIGIYLSALSKKVVGVELVSKAIADAKDNAKINKRTNVEFYCGDSARFLQKNKEKFDVIIVDPPRAGLSKDTIKNLKIGNKQRIVYVSCNPATFARDINLLKDSGILLQKVQPIDMFPQTHHIECIGILTA